ncbi:MAG: CvpA family protein [Pseudomonadota bacterium]
MDGFTLIDGIVGALIVISALLAYSRGFLREVMAIVGWIAAAFLAFMFVGQAEPLVRQLPVVGDFLGDACNELSIVAAFGLVFVVALVVVSIFTPLLSALVHRSAFGAIDQALGFLFGVVRGLLLVAIAFFIYDTVITSQDIAVVDQSRSAAVFGRFTDDVQERDPEAALTWVTTRYETLLGSCER